MERKRKKFKRKKKKRKQNKTRNSGMRRDQNESENVTKKCWLTKTHCNKCVQRIFSF